ncbi:unnamed protein product [Linum tenue]|uniref:Uncharacterized protein n=1 Tax=Linum tenue TaxID=586396 RepID=A0AAV0GRZ5_9ROSI|nr:unnamed protein product [Linum tenue]
MFIPPSPPRAKSSIARLNIVSVLALKHFCLVHCEMVIVLISAWLYSKKFETDEGKKDVTSQLEKMKYATVVRVLAQTQISEMKGLEQKKAYLMEFQVNGGDITKKVDFAYSFFEKQVPIDAVFVEDEIHWCGQGVSYTVAKAGQNGYHHCTEMNKKTYKLGKSVQDSHSAMTSYDKTEKDITPIGGFPHYGTVKEDYIFDQGLLCRSQEACGDIDAVSVETDFQN